jgi:hypothetical protein
MAMPRARDQVNERRWLRLLQEKEASGESVAAFCGQRRIPVHQFYWWQRELSHRGPQVARLESSRAPQFVPVRVPLVTPTIELMHPSGCVVRLLAGVDA